jgi:hypothetical protein
MHISTNSVEQLRMHKKHCAARKAVLDDLLTRKKEWSALTGDDSIDLGQAMLAAIWLEKHRLGQINGRLKRRPCHSAGAPRARCSHDKRAEVRTADSPPWRNLRRRSRWMPRSLRDQTHRSGARAQAQVSSASR